MDTELEWTAEQREYLQTFLHEVRSPLMSVMGFSEGLAEGIFVGDKFDAIVQLLVENANHIGSLVETFSTALKSQHPPRVLSLSPGSLSLLVAAACSPAWITEAGPHHQERVTVDVEAHGPVEVDPMRLRRVVTNLVENALRHTTGPVEVCVEQRELCLVVEVSDRGNGISDDTRNGKGHTGLGLSIVQNLVYNMRGTVEWLPREDGGTCVRAELPFVGQHQ